MGRLVLPLQQFLFTAPIPNVKLHPSRDKKIPKTPGPGSKVSQKSYFGVQACGGGGGEGREGGGGGREGAKEVLGFESAWEDSGRRAETSSMGGRVVGCDMVL